MASPPEIFFRYLVISAELSAVEAEILTRGKEPEEEESSARHKRGNIKQTLYCRNFHFHCFEMTENFTISVLGSDV